MNPFDWDWPGGKDFSVKKKKVKPKTYQHNINKGFKEYLITKAGFDNKEISLTPPSEINWWKQQYDVAVKEGEATTYRKGDHLWKEQDILDWQKKISQPENKGGWSKAQIKDLQIKLGVEPTGKYDPETAALHTQYFANQGKYGLSSAQVGLQTTKQEYLKYAQEQRMAKVKEHQQVKSDMFNLYIKYFGHAPSRGTMADLVSRAEKGWGLDDFDRSLRSNPEFKKEHPGITDNITIEDYETLKNDVYSNFINLRGRPPQPHEIADVLHGRKLKPIGGMGQTPNFDINSNLGGI